MTATATSIVVARVYSRGPLPVPPQTEAHYEPVIQELFYDWILTLVPSQRVGTVLVSVRDEQKPHYRLRVKPETAIVSDLSPSWMSGFTEPRAPDYYKRSIRFENLSGSATITIRRPIKFLRGTNQFSASSFPLSEYEVADAQPCIVTKSDAYSDAQQRMLHLMTQIWGLSNWKYGKDKPPVKVWLDPDKAMPELRSGEGESSFETQCSNDPCDKATISTLEARINRKSPDQK
jgi:hypothetical protein